MEKKEKNKRRKRRLSALLLLLLLTAVMLSTATYAWFTANRTVRIDDITVNVEASGGLQVSTDAQNWKTLITNDDIINPPAWDGNTNQFPSLLTNVSTAGLTSGTGRLQMYKGNVSSDTGEFLLTTTQEEDKKGTEGSYVAFDIFIRADVTGDDTTTVPLYLTTQSQVVSKEGDTDTGLKNASRIAFVEEGYTPASSAVGTMQALTGSTKSHVTIWEPNAGSHTQAGVNNGISYYSHIAEVASIGTGDANTVLPYDGVKAGITNGITLAKANATNNADSFQAVKTGNNLTLLTTNKDFNTAPQFITVHRGVNKYRVYLWIEGQDIDCENMASGHAITFNMGLSLDQ